MSATCEGIEREFFEKFSIQTSSTRSCTVMSSLYRVNELTVNLRLVEKDTSRAESTSPYLANIIFYNEEFDPGSG